MKEMDTRKTWALVGTIAAILLCGCPGLGACLFGAVTLLDSMPDFINGYGTLPGWIGFIGLCLAILGVAVAVLVPVLLLRKPAAAKAVKMLPPDEPLPPTS
jgi:hypothetical protein